MHISDIMRHCPTFSFEFFPPKTAAAAETLYRTIRDLESYAPHFVSVDRIAVTPGGTVAWIQHGGTLASSGYSVHTASIAKPADYQLASGAVNPRSLTLTPTTVSWLEGGQRRSAPI